MSVSLKNNATKTKNTRPSSNLKESQDRRLTSRHIAALMKLDDTVLENEQLKSKVDLLEKEFGSCLELHEIARNAKEQLSNMREECKLKINSLVKQHNETILQLQFTHKSKIDNMSKIFEREKDNLSQKLSEAQDIIEKVEIEKTTLLEKNENLFHANSEMHIVKKESQNKTEQFLEVQEKHNLMKKESLTLKTENIELESYKTNFESKMKFLQLELTKLKLHIENSEFHIEEQSYVDENKKLSAELDTLSNDKKNSDKNLEEMKLHDIEKNNLINNLNKRISLYEIERGAIIQSSNDMAIEIKHLKEELGSLTVVNKVALLPESSRRGSDHILRLSKSDSVKLKKATARDMKTEVGRKLSGRSVK